MNYKQSKQNLFVFFQDDNIQGNIYDDDDDEELFVDDKDKAKEEEEVSKTDDKKDNENENNVEDTTTEDNTTTKDNSNNDDISKLLEETKVPELPDINSVKKSVKFPEIVAKVRTLLFIQSEPKNCHVLFSQNFLEHIFFVKVFRICRNLLFNRLGRF